MHWVLFFAHLIAGFCVGLGIMLVLAAITNRDVDSEIDPVTPTMLRVGLALIVVFGGLLFLV